ncbi:hypothetical protein NDU88_003043 [Pleurodeles waltl]|uniref:Uncharacterized protein n=1 Tax=Pleurodeles waltl TaxID=8319 RepID=A0AAV7M391_PLEWA|nr:hypothetical protein NDU88_003043 [Pleurodeles waltl]
MSETAPPANSDMLPAAARRRRGRKVARSLHPRRGRGHGSSDFRACLGHQTPGAAAGVGTRARSLTRARLRGPRGTAGSKEPAPAREKLHERWISSVPPPLESAV